MLDPRITLKDPLIAGLLAWLVPGAGHFYQGRHVKGAIYAVCILGLCLTGWAMADWSAVQPPDLRRPLANKTLLLKCAAQYGVGLTALQAINQGRRHLQAGNVPTKTIDAPLAADFEGVFLADLFPHIGGIDSLMERMEWAQQHADQEWPLDRGQPAQGRIALEPVKSDLGTPAIAATFVGTVDGKAAELQLDYAALEEPLRAQSRRRVYAVARDPRTAEPKGILVASVPRSWWNYAAVPMSPREENQLHSRHGSFLEIWTVFTWIAGLLNMLVIWDACQGPAYAYGDEPPEDDDATAEANKATVTL